MANWYYFRDRRIEGPVNDDALRMLIESQEISSETLLWSEKLDAWKKLREIDPFKLTIEGESAPLPGSQALSAPEGERPLIIDIQEPQISDPGPEIQEPAGPESREPEVERDEPKIEADKPKIEREHPGFEDEQAPDPEIPGVSERQNGPASREYQFSRPGGFMYMDSREDKPSSVESSGPAVSEKSGIPVSDTEAVLMPESNWNAGNAGYQGEDDEGVAYHAAGEDRRDKDRKLKEVNQRRPWVRFLAKVVDHLLWIGVFSYALYLFGEYADPALHVYVYYRPDAFAYAEYVPYLVIFLAYMLTFILFEALLLSTLGTSVGKWLLGTSVRAGDGSRLGYPRALARGFGVWIKGLGLGIPVVSLVTLLVSYSNLTGEYGKTSWDRSRNNFVLHRRLNFFGILAVLIILLAFITVSLAALVISGLIEVPGHILTVLYDLFEMLNINITP